MNDPALKARVAEFWDAHPCGSFATERKPGERAFFEDVAAHRYASHPFLDDLIGGRRFEGQRVLEVGCGLGIDLRRLASDRADVVGLDISAKSVALARQHFQVYGTDGEFVRSDSEHMPFADQSFDVVYSFGVLHHTPDTQAAIDECRRVLKDGGQLIVMLYNRTSWHVVAEPYLFAAKRWILREQLPPGTTDPAEVVRRYDGADNPLGKAYSQAELESMLRGFSDVRLGVFQPKIINGSWPVRSYSRLLEWSGITRKWGFWIVARAARPSS
jgi:ubiquinone/menaquinone biosynthesis C-methylase UbiE